MAATVKAHAARQVCSYASINAHATDQGCSFYFVSFHFTLPGHPLLDACISLRFYQHRQEDITCPRRSIQYHANWPSCTSPVLHYSSAKSCSLFFSVFVDMLERFCSLEFSCPLSLDFIEVRNPSLALESEFEESRLMRSAEILLSFNGRALLLSISQTGW